MTITRDIRYIGVNDRETDLFEGQYPVKNGMAYNSYCLTDEKIAVFDTVDARFTARWLANLREALGGRQPDYLIVSHMEPDHSAGIAQFLSTYPGAAVVASAKAFTMMKNFFGDDFSERRVVVSEGDTLAIGRHTLQFFTAPMVHWPEVIVTYDSADKVLFSADGFGKFGALDAQEEWACEARRYYFGIVGKYGAQVQALLKKAAGLDIAVICPLHGPVLKAPLNEYLRLYDTWSSYEPEDEGVVIAYTSVYGHTKEAVKKLEESLLKRGAPKVCVHDLARCDMSEAVEDAFRYGRLVLATTTYNADIFPFMREFIEHLTERNFQNRTVAFMENGSWAPQAVKVMRAMLKESRRLNFCQTDVHIQSALSEESLRKVESLAEELTRDYAAAKNSGANGANGAELDPKALYRIGYGLYVVTVKSGEKDNGLIVNTVTQVTDSPCRVAVTVNKANYSHQMIRQTGKMNVNCLSGDTPFKLFEQFGFQSGKNTDKFAGNTPLRSENGLVILPAHINAFLSLEVEQTIDLGSHSMFICRVTEARTVTDAPSMTYDYYQRNVKPKPKTQGKKGFVCKICGYVYEGDELPEDFICPLCKHGAADFEPIT